MESDLIFSVGGLPPLSARGCIQELTPLALGQLRRTVNGKLVYIGADHQQKYYSVITCQDKTPFAHEGLWRGSLIKVGCIQRLWQKVKGETVTLERDPIVGSIVAIDQAQKPIDILAIEERTLTLSSVENVYISYRPWLEMRVVTFLINTDEWGVKAGWKLETEEV